MPLRSIVVILVRYRAVLGFVSGVVMLLGQGAFLFSLSGQAPSPMAEQRYYLFLYAGLTLVTSLCLWFLAEWIARLISKGELGETTVNMGGLTRCDLYAFAMVLVGLYFIGESISQAMNWIIYNYNPDSWRYFRGQDHQRSAYTLLSHLVPLIVGLVLLLQANRWSKLLASHSADAEGK